MSNFFVPSKGLEDWKNLLAEPSKQWRSGYSAKALAYCWEESSGFPDSVKRVFLQSTYPFLKEIEILAAFPEYRVPLPGGSRPSQNDIFILAKSQGNLVSIAVEGKVEEPFGPLVSEWQENDHNGKRTRLKFICDQLELSNESLGNIRYQLLHRTVSALIEARRFNATKALMLIHSFGENHAWFDDYQVFLGLFGKNGKPNSVTFAGMKRGVELYLSWVIGEKKYLEV